MPASSWIGTGILLESRGRRGYFSCFYARRALRTFPPHYVVLVVIFLLLPMVDPGFRMSPIFDRQARYWLVAFNWWVARSGEFPHGDFLNPLWSLGVEEQFHLVWRFVVSYLSPRAQVGASILIVASAFSVRAWCNLHGWPHMTLYASTVTRMDGLAIAAVVAALPRSGIAPATVSRWASVAAAVAAAVLIGFFLVERTVEIDGTTLGQTAIEVIAAWLVAETAWSERGTILVRSLRASLLRWAGTRSYALYLVHQPIAFLLAARWTGERHQSPIPDHVAFFCLGVSASAVVAEVSWRALERPMLALKRWFVVGEATASSEGRAAPAPAA